jgi:hypothetical protein
VIFPGSYTFLILGLISSIDNAVNPIRDVTTKLGSAHKASKPSIRIIDKVVKIAKKNIGLNRFLTTTPIVIESKYRYIIVALHKKSRTRNPALLMLTA